MDYLEVTGSEAIAYREQCNAVHVESGSRKTEYLAESVLAGEISSKILTQSLSTFDLFWIEDYVTAVGQGAFADRHHERLGQTDRGIILIRKMFDRELATLANGAQLTQWRDPPKGLTDEKAPLQEVHESHPIAEEFSSVCRNSNDQIYISEVSHDYRGFDKLSSDVVSL